jgi:hypothetical protein
MILILSCLFIINTANSRSLYVVPYWKWSCKITFKLSPSPLIKGYGYYSDSLSRAFNGVTFYEHYDEYYPIESWADYYLWFTKEYWFEFDQPELYEYYYIAKDDFGMAQYICSHCYRGRFYPARFAVSFPGRSVYVNNLSRRNIRRCIKNDSWENRNYDASAEIKKDNKNRRKPIATKYDNIRVVDREKLQNNKRDTRIVKYNNSCSTVSRTNDVDSRRVERKSSFDTPKRGNSTRNTTWRATNNRNSNNSINRNSSFNNNRSINRNTSTNTNRSSIKRTTNSKQTPSGGTIKSR